eukprot:COSAG01_NODE_56_length_31088_cov_39.354771_18_plen_92_part_00
MCVIANRMGHTVAPSPHATVVLRIALEQFLLGIYSGTRVESTVELPAKNLLPLCDTSIVVPLPQHSNLTYRRATHAPLGLVPLGPMKSLLN